MEELFYGFLYGFGDVNLLFMLEALANYVRFGSGYKIMIAFYLIRKWLFVSVMCSFLSGLYGQTRTLIQ